MEEVVVFLAGLVAIAIFLPVVLNILGELLRAILPFLIWGGIIGVSALIISNRRAIARGCEALIRWYYFTFHPHPAAPIVRASLSGRRTIAGAELAAALGEAPPDNRILREVRIAQGERLVVQMQQVSDQMIRQTVRNAQADNARAAVLGIQEAVALAALALERAKTAHEASKQAR